jgi:cytochrome b involved in lipid metabolism
MNHLFSRVFSRVHSPVAAIANPSSSNTNTNNNNTNSNSTTSSTHNVNNNNSTNGNQNAQATKSDTTIRIYTAGEVAAHNTVEDCWLIIRGKVYNVTPYVYDHPGGSILCQDAGRDSTASFDDIGHSSDAVALLEKFYIGDLAPNS